MGSRPLPAASAAVVQRGAPGAAPAGKAAGGPLKKRPVLQQPPCRTPAPGDAGRADTGGSGCEVVDFLNKAGLGAYTELLLDQGFEDLETLEAIEDSDMRDFGMPEQHVQRLRRALQGLRGGGDAAVDPCNPVVAFMESIGMPQYSEALLQSGFDDLETLDLIEDSDMKDLGLPRGHALKLRKKLHEHTLQAAMEEEEVEYVPSSRYTAMATTAPRPQQASAMPAKPLRRAPFNATARQAAAATRAAAGAAGVQIVAAGRPVPTEQMKTAVESSWEQVQVLGTVRVGEALYRNMFLSVPEAMSLFPPDVRRKYREWTADEASMDEAEEGAISVWESPALRRLFGKVVNAVGCTVAGLHDMSKLVPMLFKLGTRHISYGVPESYWPTLGRALDKTLEDILGDSYTTEVKHAWGTVYGFMSSIMVEGLRAAKSELHGMETMGALPSECSTGRPKSCAASDAAESAGTMQDMPSGLAVA